MDWYNLGAFWRRRTIFLTLLLLFTYISTASTKIASLHRRRSVPLDSSGSTMLADEDGLNASQMPIICLMEWSSPRCQEHAFDVPAPKFAPNFKFPTTPTTRRLTHGLRNANTPKADDRDMQILERGTTEKPEIKQKNESFFTPIVPKAFQQKNKQTTMDAAPKPTASISIPTPNLQPNKSTKAAGRPASSSTKQHRITDSAQQRRTVKPTGKMDDRPDSRTSYNDGDDYSEDEDAAREEEGYDEEIEDVDELNRLKSPATYAPYARAQLVNSGPNEMDSLWTDLSHAVDFKSGGSWRRPVTATSTTPIPSTSSSTTTTTFATTTRRIATTVFVSTTRLLETTTQASRQKLRTIQTDTTTTVPLFAVRPTTPMGELITTTTKAPIVTTDFPRTALISIASVSVIIIIAFVVFCVFRCRQSAPPAETTYPMAYNGAKQASMGMGNVMLGSGNHGYTPIPSEMSPPAHHAQQFAGMSPRVNYETMNGAATLPSALRRPNGLSNGGPQPNGLGYQTIGQNQHIVNQNGQTSPARGNGNANGGMNANSRSWGREKKKDFKEWYV